jgi:hypothetical protein
MEGKLIVGTGHFIIVIGKENDTGDNPLAATFCEIGKAKGKDIRVFVTSSTGTSEFGSKAEKKLTKDVVSETFASVDKSNYRLLLFDAESISGELKPVSGLLVWHQYYSSLQSGTETKTSYISISINFESILTGFFGENNKGLWWTGFVNPKKYNVATLAKTRWESVNSRTSLEHGSQKHRGTR